MHYAGHVVPERDPKACAAQVPGYEVTWNGRACARGTIVKIEDLLVESVRRRSRAEAGIDIRKRCFLKLRTWNQHLRDGRNRHPKTFGIEEKEQLVFLGW